MILHEFKKNKYRAMKEFQNVTGLDLRDFKLTEEGFVNKKGENALDLFKEALETTNSVPTGHKGSAYNYFESLLKKLSASDFNSIPDMNLSIKYQNEYLYDMSDTSIQISKFDQSI